MSKENEVQKEKIVSITFNDPEGYSITTRLDDDYDKIERGDTWDNTNPFTKHAFYVCTHKDQPNKIHRVNARYIESEICELVFEEIDKNV